MTEEEKKTIRMKIKAQIEALQEHITGLEVSNKPVPSDLEIDPNIRRQLINNKRSCEAQIRAAMQQVSKLEVALKRVDSPDYGICIDCEKEIPIERMMYMPEAMHCEPCEKELEKLL